MGLQGPRGPEPVELPRHIAQLLLREWDDGAAGSGKVVVEIPAVLSLMLN